MSLLRAYRELFRRNGALARLLFGEFVSSIGDWLYLVAILVVVYQEGGSPVLLGIVGAARILPYVLLSVPAGIVADRFDRRMVLIVTDLARGALMLVLAAGVILDASTIFIIAMAILAACFSTFFGPAIAAFLPTLVSEDDLGPANSAWATLDNLAFIIGPALAGILLAGGNLAVAFLLNAVTFAVVAVVLWRLPVDRRAPRGEVTEAAGGDRDEGISWRELAGPLAGPFLLDSANSFVTGGVGVLTVVIALDVLNAGEAGTGYLNAATGVGGVVAGIAGGALLARKLNVPLLIGGVAAGVGLVWLALAGQLAVAMIAMGIAVAGLLLLDIVNTTLIQRLVPDELRGRAMGVLQTSSAIMYSFGSLVVPVAASVLGVGVVLTACAVIAVLGVVAAVVLNAGRGEPKPIDPARARLIGHPIFAGLPTVRLETAARLLEPVPMHAGDVVVREGDPADRFYVIAAGSLSVTQGPEGTHLRDLGPGDVFGEIGLLRQSPRTATVTATTDGSLLALEADEFRDLVSAGPGLSTRMLDLYRGALSRT
ncbi:MAG TPA: MFS transporter [Candidatus Limnocylindria bacterium]|nr:MFS transporter [Candidatus Limnocylindria bacterium]